MNCPTDGTLLTIADRSGIEIDWCPTCRGVWLDRGELDKIIDRAATVMTTASPTDRYAGRRNEDDRRYDDDRRPGDRKRRRRGFLDDLFDFD